MPKKSKKKESYYSSPGADFGKTFAFVDESPATSFEPPHRQQQQEEDHEEGGGGNILVTTTHASRTSGSLPLEKKTKKPKSHSHSRSRSPPDTDDDDDDNNDHHHYHHDQKRSSSEKEKRKKHKQGKEKKSSSSTTTTTKKQQEETEMTTVIDISNSKSDGGDFIKDAGGGVDSNNNQGQQKMEREEARQKEEEEEEKKKRLEEVEKWRDEQAVTIPDSIPLLRTLYRRFFLSCYYPEDTFREIILKGACLGVIFGIPVLVFQGVLTGVWACQVDTSTSSDDLKDGPMHQQSLIHESLSHFIAAILAFVCSYICAKEIVAPETAFLCMCLTGLLYTMNMVVAFPHFPVAAIAFTTIEAVALTRVRWGPQLIVVNLLICFFGLYNLSLLNTDLQGTQGGTQRPHWYMHVWVQLFGFYLIGIVCLLFVSQRVAFLATIRQSNSLENVVVAFASSVKRLDTREATQKINEYLKQEDSDPLVYSWLLGVRTLFDDFFVYLPRDSLIPRRITRLVATRKKESLRLVEASAMTAALLSRAQQGEEEDDDDDDDNDEDEDGENEKHDGSNKKKKKKKKKQKKEKDDDNNSSSTTSTNNSKQNSRHQSASSRTNSTIDEESAAVSSTTNLGVAVFESSRREKKEEAGGGGGEKEVLRDDQVEEEEDPKTGVENTAVNKIMQVDQRTKGDGDEQEKNGADVTTKPTKKKKKKMKMLLKKMRRRLKERKRKEDRFESRQDSSSSSSSSSHAFVSSSSSTFLVLQVYKVNELVSHVPDLVVLSELIDLYLSIVGDIAKEHEGAILNLDLARTIIAWESNSENILEDEDENDHSSESDDHSSESDDHSTESDVDDDEDSQSSCNSSSRESSSSSSSSSSDEEKSNRKEKKGWLLLKRRRTKQQKEEKQEQEELARQRCLKACLASISMLSQINKFVVSRFQTDFHYNFNFRIVISSGESSLVAPLGSVSAASFCSVGSALGHSLAITRGLSLYLRVPGILVSEETLRGANQAAKNVLDHFGLIGKEEEDEKEGKEQGVGSSSAATAAATRKRTFCCRACKTPFTARALTTTRYFSSNLSFNLRQEQRYQKTQQQQNLPPPREEKEGEGVEEKGSSRKNKNTNSSVLLDSSLPEEIPLYQLIGISLIPADYFSQNQKQQPLLQREQAQEREAGAGDKEDFSTKILVEQDEDQTNNQVNNNNNNNNNKKKNITSTVAAADQLEQERRTQILLQRQDELHDYEESQYQILLCCMRDAAHCVLVSPVTRDIVNRMNCAFHFSERGNFREAVSGYEGILNTYLSEAAWPRVLREQSIDPPFLEKLSLRCEQAEASTEKKMKSFQKQQQRKVQEETKKKQVGESSHNNNVKKNDEAVNSDAVFEFCGI